MVLLTHVFGIRISHIELCRELQVLDPEYYQLLVQLSEKTFTSTKDIPYLNLADLGLSEKLGISSHIYIDKHNDGIMSSHYYFGYILPDYEVPAYIYQNSIERILNNLKSVLKTDVKDRLIVASYLILRR